MTSTANVLLLRVLDFRCNYQLTYIILVLTFYTARTWKTPSVTFCFPDKYHTETMRQEVPCATSLSHSYNILLYAENTEYYKHKQIVPYSHPTYRHVENTHIIVPQPSETSCDLPRPSGWRRACSGGMSHHMASQNWLTRCIFGFILRNTADLQTDSFPILLKKV